MSRDESADLVKRLRRAARDGQNLSAVPAATAARLLHLDALTLSFISSGGHLELLWADPADPMGPVLEDLQYTLGEGPTLDAVRTRRTVTEVDLSATARWPLFTPAACRTPARAVIATPLLLGVIAAGALTGYQTTPGPFPTEQQRNMARFAQVALDLLLSTPPAAMTTETGLQANGLELHRVEVHQAAGVLTVHLGLPIEDALLRLRGHAYRHGRPVLDVARDILAGRIELEPDRP
ncbi:ANTAR domain-containing protein [Streptomyces sp. YJ-C3]